MDNCEAVSWEHLPADILQHIADHFTTKEWVRMSRACRAMQALQPSTIAMVSSSLQAPVWLRKHWGQANRLTIECTSAELHLFIPSDARMPQLPCLSHLTISSHPGPATACIAEPRAQSRGRKFIKAISSHLCFRAEESSCVLERGTEAAELSPVEALKLLLSCGTSLVLLSVKCDFCFRDFDLPSLKSLRHLLLDTQVFSMPRFEAIRGLKYLISLQLRRTAYAYPVSYEMDLSSLPHLANVNISSACVTDIKMPESAVLSFSCLEEYGLSPACLSRLAESKKIECVKMRYRHIYACTFMELSQCRVLYWDHFEAIYRPYVFAGAKFTRLTELYITADNVNIHLASSLKFLNVLHIHALVTLKVASDNFEGLAAQLCECSISLLGKGYWSEVRDLANAMAAAGKRMSHVTSPVNQLCNSAGLFYGRHFWSDRIWCHPQWPCKCGACSRCLM